MTWRAARFGFIWVARATSRPREGALWVAMVQKVLSRARVGVLVACGCAGAVTTAPRARCEHCRPSRQLFRRRARARAAANARFWLLDAVAALCSRTGVRETRLRCFGAAQCQVRRPSVYTSTEQPEGMTPRSYLHSTWRYGRGGLLRVSQGCRAAPGTSERGSRCAFVVGCRKRLPRWAGWMHDSSPRPLASREIPAARRTRAQLIAGWAVVRVGWGHGRSPRHRTFVQHICGRPTQRKASAPANR